MTTQPVEEVLVGFARALRAAGVAVTADRTRAFVEATSVVGVGARVSTRAAGRATLCSGPDDLDRFDRVFDRWFGPEELRGSGSSPVATTTRAALDGDGAELAGEAVP
ncbi:MAG: hypothetical protein F2667_12130, partial [Actinobacteria bacterium]|nr:hypothetical protein [Actinomycetota bacterium]